MLSLPRFWMIGLVTSCFVALCIARPLHDTVSSSSVARSPEPETVDFKGKAYDAIPIAFCGLHSSTHQLVDGYGPAKVPAILKVVKTNDSFKGEVENLKEFDQWLDDDGERGIMLKDIRFDYPKKGDRKKHLHEWIVEDHSEWLEDLDNKVATAKKSIMKTVEDIANAKDKVVSDLSDNTFLSEDLSEASFCDLDPTYVKNLKGRPEEDRKYFLEAAEGNLERRFTASNVKGNVEKYTTLIVETDLY